MVGREGGNGTGRNTEHAKPLALILNTENGSELKLIGHSVSPLRPHFFFFLVDRLPFRKKLGRTITMGRLDGKKVIYTWHYNCSIVQGAASERFKDKRQNRILPSSN